MGHAMASILHPESFQYSLAIPESTILSPNSNATLLQLFFVRMDFADLPCSD